METTILHLIKGISRRYACTYMGTYRLLGVGDPDGPKVQNFRRHVIGCMGALK